jgi:hypothetical protein
MPFQIIQIDTGHTVPGVLIDSPTDTLAYIAALQTETGLRYRMARHVDPASAWREREALRLRDGTYTPLPAWWTDAVWWRNTAAASGHYAHVSNCGGMVAYTESADKGTADRQTRVLATRYLTRYLSDRLTPQEIVAIGVRFAQPAETQLVIKDTPEDFERVYRAAEHQSESSSYPSCMRYETAVFGTPCHPASAYSGHGLAIAYAQRPDGSIPARAVVWPAKMTFVRVYGLEESDKHNLVRLLEDAGYTRADGFDGAKLSRITYRNDERVVVPYIDGDTRRLEDCGDYLIITKHGAIDGTSTAGWSELVDQDSIECERCGAREDRDECHTVSGETWCANCANRRAFYCHATGEMHCNTVGSREVTTRRGWVQTWCEDACDSVFHCEATDTDYDGAYYTAIEVNVTAYHSRNAYPETWCEEETQDGRFYCDRTEEFYSLHYYTPAKIGDETWCEEVNAEVIAERESAKANCTAENNEETI